MKLTSVSTSSLIGVAIACSGNVLISLALTVQKLAHKRQNDELIASQSTSGYTTPTQGGEDDDEPDVDPGPDDSPERGDDERERRPSHRSTPSPSPTRQLDAVPVPVVMVAPGGTTVDPSDSQNSAVPSDDIRSDQQWGNASVASSSRTITPGMAKGSETAVPVQPISLIPVDERASLGSSPSSGSRPRSTSRSRSPIPSPLRLPPRDNINVDLSSPATARPPRHDHRSHGGTHEHSKHPGHHRHGAHDHDSSGKQEVEEGQYLKSKLWWLGMVLIAIGEGGNFLSYGFAPASVVAPLGTVALIANCIFAPLILRERFHAKELIGMGLAIIGAVTVVYSSNASNPRLDPHGLVIAIRQVPFIVYTALNVTAMITLSVLSRYPHLGGRYIAIDVGLCALFGGYTVLSTKALSSLLSTIFLTAFASWITWVLLLVLAVTSVLQVKFLNRALMRFQSKEVIPTQFVFFSLAAIIGSAVLYQEFRDVTPSSFINFAFGIATTFLGVHLLTSFSEDDDASDASSITSRHSYLSTERPIYPNRNRTISRSLPTNASLNVLLPTTSRLSSHSNVLSTSASERTPLLVPVATSPENIGRPDLESRGTAGARDLSIGPAGAGRLRLVKKSSNGDFAPTLGLGSQAGFLLMATTPPSGSAPGSLNSMGRRATSYMRRNTEGEDRGENDAGGGSSGGRRGSTTRSQTAGN